MPGIDPLQRVDSRLRRILERAWVAVRPPAAPDYSLAPAPDARELRLRRLARVRDMLEQTRTVIACDGWTSGGWFTVGRPDEGTRVVGPTEAINFCDPRSSVVNACLAGTLLRLADDPDTAPSLTDAWACVDELYEAMHERMGHTSLPPGRACSAAERRSRLRALTAWNDEPERTAEHLIELIDRAISRSIVASCQA